jgi:hypothetical protein
MCHHLAALTGDPRTKIMGFIELRCPWMPIAEAKALLVETIAKPRDGAPTSSPGACASHMPTAPRSRSPQSAASTRRSLRDGTNGRNAHARPKRNGADRQAPRLEPNISPQSRTGQPWKALGISRATWFRRRKGETASDPVRLGSATAYILYCRAGPVSRRRATPAAPSSIRHHAQRDRRQASNLICGDDLSSRMHHVTARLMQTV